VLLGEAAGLTTSLFWTLGSIFFAAAVKKIGAFNVNTIRILLGSILLGAVHFISMGTIIPHANAKQFFFMGLSAVIGLVIGDIAYFTTLDNLGPRRAVLMLSTAPIFSAVAGYIIIDETLSLLGIVGIAVTMTGVGLVILEQEHKTKEAPLTEKQKRVGVITGIIAAMAQGVGLVVSKIGMVRSSGQDGKELSPLSATLIRMVTATVVIWLIAVILRKTKNVVTSLKKKGVIKSILGGTVCGPFLGIWFSMIAVAHTKAGIAATLMSLMPVMVIPILYLIYRQKTSIRSSIGAVVTVAGVAILFLR
jgi:drug/metabolite transporter (DMT)-like permease